MIRTLMHACNGPVSEPALSPTNVRAARIRRVRQAGSQHPAIMAAWLAGASRPDWPDEIDVALAEGEAVRLSGAPDAVPEQLAYLAGRYAALACAQDERLVAVGFVDELRRRGVSPMDALARFVSEVIDASRVGQRNTPDGG